NELLGVAASCSMNFSCNSPDRAGETTPSNAIPMSATPRSPKVRAVRMVAACDHDIAGPRCCSKKPIPGDGEGGRPSEMVGGRIQAAPRLEAVTVLHHRHRTRQMECS